MEFLLIWLAVAVVVAAVWSLRGIRRTRKPTDQQIIEAREREIVRRRIEAVNDYYRRHPDRDPNKVTPHWW